MRALSPVQAFMYLACMYAIFAGVDQNALTDYHGWPMPKKHRITTVPGLAG